MTATTEIITALNQAYGSASSKAFIAAVCDGEGGMSWNTLFGAGELLPPTTYVQIFPRPLGRLWIGSISAFPTWGGAKLSGGSITHAAGGPQFEPATYAAMATLTGRSEFGAQDQIQNCWELADQVFSARAPINLHDALEATGNGLLLIPAYLGKIWPGGCDSGFPKRFANNLPLVMSTAAPQSVFISDSLARIA